MKKLFTSMLLCIVFLSLFGPMPSALAREDPSIREGDRFNLFAGTPLTFQADAPFHFAHGFYINPLADHPIGRYEFRLEVDGNSINKSFVERSDEEDGLLFIWVYNFSDGMPVGEYTFTGHWIYPCAIAVQEGAYAGPCKNPSEQVIVRTESLTVEFLP